MLKVLSKLIVFIMLSALSSFTYSASQWYLTMGPGFSVSSLGSHAIVANNSLAIPSYNQDIYSSKNNTNVALLLEMGKRWALAGAYLQSLSLGLQYQNVLPINVGNNIMQYSSPAFLNYHYSLDLKANILLLNAKIESLSWHNVSSFIHVGAGAVQLTAENYSEHANSGVTVRISPAFDDNANYRLIYQVGVGVNWKLSERFMTSIQYAYHPLGCFSTNNGKRSWSNTKLNFGDANEQSAFVTMTYLI